MEEKTKLLIASDLHINVQDKIYSLEVLDEILENAKNFDALILLGDTFNTFKDLEELKDIFIEKTKDTNVYMLKGNHEKLDSHGITLSKLSFPSNIKIIEEIKIFNINDIEIVAIPYNEKYMLENIKKTEGKRLLIAHGIVEGTIWAIEDNEENAAIPIDIIKNINPSLSLIGHIHKSMEINIEGIDIIYPGSARVWRNSMSEQGVRKCLALEINGENIVKNYIELKKAGEYRIYDINTEDSDEEKIKDIALTWSKNDSIDINISGVIEDENALEKIKNRIKNKYYKFLRNINIKNKNIIILENAENEKIIKDFLSLYEEYISASKSEEDKEIITLARSIGLEKISNYLRK